MKEISDEKWLAAIGGGLLRESERNDGIAYPFLEMPREVFRPLRAGQETIPLGMGNSTNRRSITICN